ncbi:hypothetical protein [Microcoleus sp. BROC3]|uniref:hypothetical protein n=1 Tax=Microcoleus sp. BROC3 TaxID=3055323 RepID=UPI002FD603AF
MSNKARNTSGKFAAKSDTPRKIRSVNLTDDAWQWLADVAAQAGVSRNDYIEAMAEGNIPLIETVSSEPLPLIETVKPDSAKTTEQPQDGTFPLMETVNHALTTKEEALAHVAIFGFTPEEALADAHFQIAMLQSNHDELEDRHELVKREYAALLESSSVVTNKLRGEVQELRSQLATERADREEIEAELSDLKQKSATAGKDFPDAADLLNQLKAKRKKSKTDLADMEAILEILES